MQQTKVSPCHIHEFILTEIRSSTFVHNFGLNSSFRKELGKLTKLPIKCITTNNNSSFYLYALLNVACFSDKRTTPTNVSFPT